MILKPFRNKDVTVFAETNFRDQRKKFGIKEQDRRRHMYVVGKTGMGKTAMLQHMIVQDIKAGKGVCIVDGNGSLINELLYYVPKNRVRDVIFFNPADVSYPIGFNLLWKVHDDQERQELTESLVTLFKELWSDVWGSRLEYVFKNAIETLLYDENTTFLHFLPLFTDASFRGELLRKVDNPVLLDFWQQEFEASKERFDASAIAPIQDKMGQIMSNTLIRNIIGQTKTSFNFKDILDQKKIVFLVLNKSKIGEETCKLLGTTFVTQLALTAKRYQKEPRNYYLYIDELQNFVNTELRELITTSKFGLNLILANQYLTQLPGYMKEAIFGSVGTMIAFRVGADDASALREEFKPSISEEILMKLAQHSIVLKLSIDGETSDAFTAATLEPLPIVGLSDTIIVYSREMYGHRKSDVEEEIVKALRIKKDIPTEEPLSRASSFVKSDDIKEEIAEDDEAREGGEKEDQKEKEAVDPDMLEKFRQQFEASVKVQEDDFKEVFDMVEKKIEVKEEKVPKPKTEAKKKEVVVEKDAEKELQGEEEKKGLTKFKKDGNVKDGLINKLEPGEEVVF